MKLKINNEKKKYISKLQSEYSSRNLEIIEAERNTSIDSKCKMEKSMLAGIFLYKDVLYSCFMVKIIGENFFKIINHGCVESKKGNNKLLSSRLRSKHAKSEFAMLVKKKQNNVFPNLFKLSNMKLKNQNDNNSLLVLNKSLIKKLCLDLLEDIDNHLCVIRHLYFLEIVLQLFFSNYYDDNSDNDSVIRELVIDLNSFNAEEFFKLNLNEVSSRIRLEKKSDDIKLMYETITKLIESIINNDDSERGDINEKFTPSFICELSLKISDFRISKGRDSYKKLICGGTMLEIARNMLSTNFFNGDMDKLNKYFRSLY